VLHHYDVHKAYSTIQVLRNTSMGCTLAVMVSLLATNNTVILIIPLALPFLVRTELLLAPLLPLLTAYILSLLGFNVAQHVLAAYFR
jgi:hypothetical protein